MLEDWKNQESAPVRPVPTASRWKAGLDLGATTTVYREARLQPGLSVKPKGFTVATASRTEDGAAALISFAGALRRKIAPEPRGARPWGVMSCPALADEEERRRRGRVAAHLFERFLIVDEAQLAALGILHDPVGRHAIVVDVGTASVRACLVGGAAPSPEHLTVIPGGGRAVDESLKALLSRRYPQLRLTDHAVLRMKEELSFVSPEEKEVRLKLVLGREHRMVDISDIVKEASETLVSGVLAAIGGVLCACPSDHVEEFLASIVLVGGGAALPGLPHRIQDDLERGGLEEAEVRFVEDPRSLVALGALKWALLTPDDAWELPLFDYRGVEGALSELSSR
jgi:actin-like ATPase involved in cell morphogenesis